MPTIADNIPAWLQAILEDRRFIDQESLAVRAILESPADAGMRYEAGKMYEGFGLLCPALQAYLQALTLQPDHAKAAERAKRLESSGVSPEDEEGVYQLPPVCDNGKTKSSEPNVLAIVRLGHVIRSQELLLKRLDHDDHWIVTQASDEQLRLKSRDNRILMLAVSGALAMACFAGWIIWLVVQQVTKDESFGKPTRFTTEAITLLIFAITALASLRFFRNDLTLFSDGRIVGQTGRNLLTSHQLRKGSRVHLNLEHQLTGKERQCLVSLVDENNTVMKEIGMASLEYPCALFEVKLAATVAAITGIPLEVAGSLRFKNPELRALLCKLSDAMQPAPGGGAA